MRWFSRVVDAGPSAGQALIRRSQAGRTLFSVTGQSSEAIVFSLLSLQDGVTAPNVRFQLISKLFGQTLRCVFSVVVVILEVENKAA